MISLGLTPAYDNMLQDSSDEKYTLYGVAISLFFFGLLCCSEVRMIKVKDALVIFESGDTFIQVKFKYHRKRRNKGFTYYIPSSFVPL